MQPCHNLRHGGWSGGNGELAGLFQRVGLLPKCRLDRGEISVSDLGQNYSD